MSQNISQIINSEQNTLKFLPKSTSSTTSLFNMIRRQAIKCTRKCRIKTKAVFEDSFSVSSKARLRRCSTPKSLLHKSSMRKLFSKRKHFQPPLSSTFIHQHNPISSPSNNLKFNHAQCSNMTNLSGEKAKGTRLEKCLDLEQNQFYIFGDFNVWIV